MACSGVDAIDHRVEEEQPVHDYEQQQARRLGNLLPLLPLEAESDLKHEDSREELAESEERESECERENERVMSTRTKRMTEAMMRMVPMIRHETTGM